jgi:hypothetical protein
LHTHSILSRYGFFWVTLALFCITLSGHWVFGWFAYVREQTVRGQAVEVSGYTIQMMMPDTLENWQSEFLQLRQVAGLAILLHVGSPQSKEGDDRMEAKIDAILLAVEPKKGSRIRRPPYRCALRSRTGKRPRQDRASPRRQGLKHAGSLHQRHGEAKR